MTKISALHRRWSKDRDYKDAYVHSPQNGTSRCCLGTRHSPRFEHDIAGGHKGVDTHLSLCIPVGGMCHAYQ
jgi:hypothetical protein